MSERLYPQCHNGGRMCALPDCGPPYCLPDGTYTRDPVAAARALQVTRNTRPRSPQAAEARERARLAHPTPPWEEQGPPAPGMFWCGRDGHGWMVTCNHLDGARYPSETWERIPVADVRYPGLTRRLSKVRRFQLEKPAYRRQFDAVNRLACATLVVVPPVCWVLTGGQSASPMAAALIGLTTTAISAVRMLVFVTRQRHTA